MILLLAFDYIFGELAYSAFDRVAYGIDVFALYFFALMGIEAVICYFMFKINSMRATAYATLNIIAIPAHFYGLYVFVGFLDSSTYASILLSLLCAKIAVVVMPDVRNHIRRCVDNFRDSMAYSPSFVFITSTVRANS
tara:strand:- start:71136 stop:71549 length:414 start_codon:yes stop_codon:yes gene_type:complete